ncbi:hypothetical protein ARMGADRAFT_1163757 [Armillaria gallica]|uniref:Uncharacterized protein n=1 Tax=Armillaria gallica TaxID=47427 RepID=A0A2H3E3C2_ARMGA|nr:hypothetical protein ARMGADRAFT_1163757 [Armillaria gallica]
MAKDSSLAGTGCALSCQWSFNVTRGRQAFITAKEGVTTALSPALSGLPACQPAARHSFPTSLPKRAAVTTSPSSSAILPRLYASPHLSITIVLVPYSFCVLPHTFPLSSHRSKVNRGAYVWCPPSSESEDEDEGVNEPSFKLHTASFSDVPRVCTEWRDFGYGFDAYRRMEDSDREPKRRRVEYHEEGNR